MSKMPDFTPGLELSRRFYLDAVAPLLGVIGTRPAGLGDCSKVLGVDIVRSTDHGRGRSIRTRASLEHITPRSRAADVRG
jgi:hypothetical protein